MKNQTQITLKHEGKFAGYAVMQNGKHIGQARQYKTCNESFWFFGFIKTGIRADSLNELVIKLEKSQK